MPVVRPGVLRRYLPGLLFATFLGCRPASTETPPAAPIAAAGLDVTLDATEPLIIEDDARRRAPPPDALRQRVYYVERSLHRWHPPARPVTHGGLWLAPYIEPSFPLDHVALVGSPAPVPGERFVVFDDTGRLAVVEATGEACPAGVVGCIVCADDDPARNHWARVIDGSLNDRDFALALGPFTADEPLPSPRWFFDAEPVRRGRWTLTAPIDLDDDGAIDEISARTDCLPGRRCDRFEHWRRHDGRWYAEPDAPSRPPAPLHFLELLDTGDSELLSYFGGEESIGGPGRVVVTPSDIDDVDPVAGDYWILASRGVIGRLRFPEDHRESWCLVHGPSCHEAELIAFRPPRNDSRILVAGPIPRNVDVRAVELPRTPRYAKRWDPNRATPELALELTDGTRWTVTSRPCIKETFERPYRGMCFETRIERPGVPPHRHLVGNFVFIDNLVAKPVCRDL